MIEEKAYARWRRALPNVKRGTPLEDRPSRRYWRERTADQDLPEQLIVLPLEGMWSERISDRTALVVVGAVLRRPIRSGAERRLIEHGRGAPTR